MKILFLTPRGSGKNLGGVEGHVRILTEELERRGNEVNELSLDEIDGLNKLRAWRNLWKKRDLFRWAEVIHVHDVFWWVMPLLPIIKLNKSYKGYKNYKNSGNIYTTFHGWEGVCPPTRSAVWQKRLAKKLSQGTIGVGNFFKKWYGVKPDRIVWGVVEDKLINRQIDKSTNRQIKNLKIVFLGRLEEVNGVEILLRALKVRPWRTPRSDLFRFVFVGDGSYRKQAEKYGKVTGMVMNPEKYLADADVVITSSYMSMLEVAAMGKPIVAIANNELKIDYLKGHPLGNYIEICRDSDELIRRIASLQFRKDAIQNAREWAVRQTAESLADVYEELWNLK